MKKYTSENELKGGSLSYACHLKYKNSVIGERPLVLMVTLINAWNAFLFYFLNIQF